MTGWRHSLPRRVVAACLLIVLGQLILLAVLVASPQTGKPHLVPVTVVAPTVVGVALAEEADGLSGTPFAATAAVDADEARSDVADGLVVASLVVDLRGTRDDLYLNAAREGPVNDAVLDKVAAIDRSTQRTVRVHVLGDPAPNAQQRIDTFTLLTSALGFLIVLVISLTRGPIARTTALGALRIAGVGVVAVAIGSTLVRLPWISLPGHVHQLAVVGALAILLAATTTLALEALAGLPGLALAATFYFVFATPLLIRTDPYLLPAPWPIISAWTHTGATRSAVMALAYFEPARAIRPVLVMLAWFVIAVLTLFVARRARGHAVSHAGVVRWRLRVVAVIVPVAVLMLAAISFQPHHTDPPLVLADKAARTTCLGVGDLRSVADLNRITGRLRGGPEFQGADVGADVQLQDGRRLWVFGDTLRGADFAGQRFVRNSMLVVEPDCLQVVLPKDHGALVPDRSDGVGYWPMSIGLVERPGYDLVGVATQRVRSTGTGAFDFENLGPSIAVFAVRRGGTPQLVAQQDIGPDNPDRSVPTWGAATAISGGYVYFYGTANPGQDYVFGFSLRVARVRPDDMLDAGKWRYWDGSAWVADAGRAAELIPAQGGVSQTLSVFEQDGRWYALSKRDDFLGTDLTIWTAPGPTGPFTPGAPLAKLPSDTARGELRYMPLAHPDLLPRPGTIVVSYSQNNTDVQDVKENPFLYRPRFLRVDLPD